MLDKCRIGVEIFPLQKATLCVVSQCDSVSHSVCDCVTVWLCDCVTVWQRFSDRSDSPDRQNCLCPLHEEDQMDKDDDEDEDDDVKDDVDDDDEEEE